MYYHIYLYNQLNEVLITESQYHSKIISIWEYHMFMFGRYFMLASRKMCLKIYTYAITEQLKLAAGIFGTQWGQQDNRVYKNTLYILVWISGLLCMITIKALQNKYKKAIAIIK